MGEGELVRSWLTAFKQILDGKSEFLETRAIISMKLLQFKIGRCS